MPLKRRFIEGSYRLLIKGLLGRTYGASTMDDMEPERRLFISSCPFYIPFRFHVSFPECSYQDCGSKIFPRKL